MCRFLLVKSRQPIDPQPLVRGFANMAATSRTPDGDWQGDGWGIAWKVQTSKFKVQNWQVYKSLKPIWKDKAVFHQFPKTNLLAIHARSASFVKDKGKLEYNQPYLDKDLCFVFNGLIAGVKLTTPLAGIIGAQKLFSLLRLQLKQDPEQALTAVSTIMHSNSRTVVGMNIGLIKGRSFYVLCDYEKYRDYFSLYYYKDKDLTLVCSEKLSNILVDRKWKLMRKGEIKKF